MVQKGADATCRGTRPQEPHSSVAAIRDRRLQLREIDGSARQHPPWPNPTLRLKNSRQPQCVKPPTHRVLAKPPRFGLVRT